MRDIDMSYLCTTIGNLSGIPIRIFEDNRQIFYYSTVYLPKDPLSVYWEEVQKIDTSIAYFATNHFHYYGIVNSKNKKIVIGPTMQTQDDTQQLKDLAFRADVPKEDMDDFILGMKSIIRMPLESIMQILCTINYVLNNEKKTLKDIAIYDEEQENLRKSTQQEQILNSFDNEKMQEDILSIHNSFDSEQTLMDMIRRGDLQTLEEWMSNAPAIRSGVLAAEQLRQQKNLFIVTATLSSRAAIRGGMDVNDALSLSDSYIQKCEKLNFPDMIMNLQYHMVLDFTWHVNRLRHGKQPTKLLLDVTNYIRHHMSEAITSEAIAKELYMSRPYLSRKFKEETGETLTDFILNEKITEAKRLLRYTDKSLTAISSYLGFSSQSHFSRVFKKYAAITPGEYREKHTK